MKPPPFGYHDPEDLEETLALLAEHGAEGKLLAGGQSLVPLLNFRLAHPAQLIDLNRVRSLSGIRRREGLLTIGAMTRQATLERSQLVAREWPLLNEALGFVAHAQIRNRGTVGGSIAHSDPAAEIPVAMTALEAIMRVRSQRGERTIPASEFFVTHLTTALDPDELLVEIEVPPLPAATGSAFVEFARRHGDFALGGAAALITLDDAGACTRAAISLLAAAPTPRRAREGEMTLIGKRVDERSAADAAARAIAEIEPTGDIHGSSAYRKRLIGALIRRAVVAAGRRAETVA